MSVRVVGDIGVWMAIVASPGASFPTASVGHRLRDQGVCLFLDAGWRDEQIVRLVPPRPQDTPVLRGRHERPLPDFGCCRQYTWRQYRTREGVAGASTGTGEGRLSTEDMEWTAQRSGGWRGRGEVWVVRPPLPLPTPSSQGSGIEMAWSTPPSPLRQGASLPVSSLASWSVVGGGRPARLESGIFIEAGSGLRACAPRVASCWACRGEMTASFVGFDAVHETCFATDGNGRPK